jgi:hypothetical protein
VLNTPSTGSIDSTVVLNTPTPGLKSLSQRALDLLYHEAAAGEIPNGVGEGVALVAPGTFLTRPAAGLVRMFFWHGKTVDASRLELRNRITPFGLPSIRARLYYGSSLVDGAGSIILDYARTSVVARFVRDEIRMISPGIYLGYAYAFGIRWITFALIFAEAK